MSREGHRLQFRFEAFNLTNKPQFWPPNTNIGRAPAGTISNAADSRLTFSEGERYRPETPVGKVNKIPDQLRSREARP